ncbi:sulfotransferase [Sphaerospermopsis aphanizomenoides BCCUSP55]|uniref:sulfotransferase family protein n=1 Tax=Sphaerospermopsis aphanizomenoides TaxID=459663 RepID=UPI000A887FAE|nr:sulfotransferase [Sphaerospermopsis aphanizomenoides]MBK1989422.1 sulfotransferase [Sphaerospermopsis aphanizomenoides BCCUSP55]
MSVPHPVIILASPRSFTSLVCAMLGQHPEAYGVPEINLFVKETLQELVDVSRGARQFILHGLLRTIAQLYSGEQTIESVAMAQRWITQRLDYNTADIYWHLCNKIAPLRIIDKSPAYPKQATTLQRIHKTFPNAFYLYITRHPREQGKSMMKAPQAVAELAVADSVDYSLDPPIIDPQYEWYRTQSRILEFLNTIPSDQHMFIRGEEIISNPETYLDKICHRLGLSWNEAAYQAMLQTEKSSYACMGPYGTEWGNNPGFQKSPIFRPSASKPSKLEGPLPWRKDKKGFLPEVIYLARELGYE